MQDMLLILDFDHRYSTAAALRLRGEGIYCRILPGDSLPQDIMAMSPLGIVLAGGARGDVPLSLDGRLLRAGIPLLALGNTAASLLMLLNGKVGAMEEKNAVDTVRFEASRLTDDMTESERMLGTVYPLELTEELSPIAYVGDSVIGFRHNTLPLYAMGFQVEPNDPEGSSLLFRFAREICGCSDWWNESAFIAAARSDISSKVGDGVALCALTGGLDSGVAAAIAHRALGDRLRCVFIDTGLLRQNEVQRFLSYYQEEENLHITLIHAQDAFLSALAGLKTRREKLDAIDRTMRETLRRAACGTEYSAVIRGLTCTDIMRVGKAAAMLPEEGKTVIAPLSELFKEEVRVIGEKLGLPPALTAAQPFPATGLALRITGEADEKRLNTLRAADALFVEEIERAGLHKRLWKYYVTMHLAECGADSGESELILHAVSLVDSQSGGTAAIPSRLPYDLLERVVEKIRLSCPDVRRVAYDLTSGGGLMDTLWE